jgi:hypothetical protein
MAMCYPDSTDWGCALTPEEVAALDPVVKDRSEMLAWTSLQRLTGFRLALCSIVVRPCAARCNPGVWMEAPVSGFPADGPYISGGRWYNACGCIDPNSCSCGPVSEVILPAQEVSGPIVVKINGGILDPSSYRVDNGNRLIRTDGGSWPLCQDMSEPESGAAPYVFTFEAGSTESPAYGGTITFSRSGSTVTATIDAIAAQDIDPYLLASTFPDLIPLGYRLAGSGRSITVQLDPEVVTASFPDFTPPNLFGFYSTAAVTAGFHYQATITWETTDPAPAGASENTFSVSYYPGIGPDDALNFAAGLLAVEWYKACTGKDCRLPNGATRVIRQGISFEVPADMFANGLSGIREVDNIVGAYNPYRLVSPSSVFNPDARRAGRVRTA